ncbi:hypothetical protein GCM10023264_15030 [Sphingomonas daechungensis]|uniref:Lipoprotein n=1 Tax=Sphingomonas daechungensis TaxID=1176646 RepID=A0ABX6T5K6_9SPHN|nr:hypothetical protein [Sphingomonas daechungensis]QNP44217.1 hypothetical protein H9L15_06960 [Sphingomonas daechungensis]
MRALSLLLSAAALASCATQPPSPTEAAESQAKLASLTAGKVAGQPLTCLPPGLRSANMEIIDDSTIAYREGSRLYVNHLRGSCSNLKSGFYTLVVRSGGSGQCSGDIADVTDVRTGMTAGSCALGEFVPYRQQ